MLARFPATRIRLGYLPSPGSGARLGHHSPTTAPRIARTRGYRMSNPLICFRPTPAQRAAIVEVATAHGITMSEYLRMLVEQQLTSGMFQVDEGYMEARSLALKLAHEVLRRAMEMLPQNYEDAVPYFGLAGPGPTTPP